MSHDLNLKQRDKAQLMLAGAISQQQNIDSKYVDK